MRILILGAAGFIGTALCRRLQDEGHDIIALSRSELQLPMLPNCRRIQATLDDRQVLDATLGEADYVFHLAWDTTPGTSAAQPSLEISNNLLPSMRLLEAMQERPGLPLAFMSSGGALFGSTADELLHESVPISPSSYYGAGKAAMEHFLGAFAHRSASPVVLLRASNLYGPGQRPKRQFGLIPTLFDSILRSRPLEIWGDGEIVRDFLYINDFLDLCVRLLTWDAELGKTTALNVGSGCGLSINALCNRIEAVTGEQLQLLYRPARSVDADHVTIDNSLAKRLLGWQVRTSIDDGLRQTWAWIKSLG